MTQPTSLDPARRQVLEALLRTEWPRLRRFFESKVPVSECHDLAQSTLLAYLEAPVEPHQAKAFLWGIARNKVRQYYERQRPAMPFDSTVHTADEASRSLGSRLDDRSQLVAALQRLPLDQQTAFELRYGEELSLDEVSLALGVSLATTKRYLAAAEAKLREWLGADADDCASAYRRS